VGSLVTSKAIPKDADLLVTINGAMNLGELARAGRRLKGSAQHVNATCEHVNARQGVRALTHLLTPRTAINGFPHGGAEAKRSDGPAT
jgi:hypothetical protein